MESSAQSRLSVIRDIHTRIPHRVALPADSAGRPLNVSEYYGINTFDLERIKALLPKQLVAKFMNTIEAGRKLDKDVADGIANAVKDWAISKGVTHFCHWFQPQTGLTAEKHDAFVSFDDNGKVIEKFSGSQLIQSEPDASSFPSGGMRTTFEARGYTAWDPTSPMFIRETPNTKTLCIPSVFISYHGDALDEKAPLLRSNEILSARAVELAQLIGDRTIKRVISTLGAEQEYFLIDRAFYNLRQDLVMSGRTLVGAQPPKGQQLEDHYFGSIAPRVQAFMGEFEMELYRIGVPVKTRHNEVAPAQYETAPIFEDASVAIDHNQMTMDMLRRVARRHGFEALLHEKPFAGVNGSGKHCNWSMAVTASGEEVDGENLLDPGKTPRENLRFLLFLVGVLKGVHRHSGLMRAAIASSGNDHRLGANEAPPAIISVFLGNQLSNILDQIEQGIASSEGTETAVLKLGVSKLPVIAKDNTDRNRTSPFAFTGNKFEFRAVGSSASPALPVTVLNGAVAEALGEVTARIKDAVAKGQSQDQAIWTVIREIVKETKSVRFEGNNYSGDWHKEAATRGLLNLPKTPESLEQLVAPSSKKMLVELGIFSEIELNSRFHVRNEQYVKNLLIETDCLKHMVDTQILPAAFAYHAGLAEGIASAKAAGIDAPQSAVAARLGKLIAGLQDKRTELDGVVAKIDNAKSEEEKAKILSKDGVASLLGVRQYCDELEGVVADAYWPLPKYREMLFLI